MLNVLRGHGEVTENYVAGCAVVLDMEPSAFCNWKGNSVGALEVTVNAVRGQVIRDCCPICVFSSTCAT